MGSRSHVDVVIIGAGAAGLGASLEARKLGLDTVTVEASERIGGRAWTTREPFGYPWDVGCHWLHSGSLNPFARLADESGFRYRTTRLPWHSVIAGRPTTTDEETVIDAFIDTTLDAATRCGAEGIDVPVADFVDSDDPIAEIFRYDINAEWGVDPRAASTLDLARYRDTGENWPVEEGYGALVARAAAAIVGDVSLNTPVEAIDWTGQGVRVTTPAGTIVASAVIVTASTGVLADDVIAFDPSLPVWKQEAIAAVPMGRANKVALQVDARALAGVEDQGIVVPIGDGAGHMIGMRLRPFGRNLVDGYVGGPVCTELEAAGEAAMIDTATEALVSLLGSDVRTQVVATAVSRWASQPYIRGAYAAALPGQADRRADLARSLDNRIYFAGEATSPEFFTTCHGAWQSGIAAARSVAESLNVAPATAKDRAQS